MKSPVCKICGRNQKDRPQIFKGEDYCCDLHRKALGERKIDGET